jgi:hypothetical protein
MVGQVCEWYADSYSFGYIPRSGIAGYTSHGDSNYNIFGEIPY